MTMQKGENASLLEQTWGTDTARSSQRLTRLPEYDENVPISALSDVYQFN